MGSKDKHDDDESLSTGLKVMLAAAISLFAVISIIIIVHFSVKYFIRRQQRRRQNELLHQITTQIAPIDVSSVEPRNPGLQTSIIASLPKVLYNQTEQFKQGEVIECSVCLATVMEDAMTRVLPNCKHIFHVGCVDKWFNSNTTCPICRTVVDPKVSPEEEHVQPTAPPVVGLRIGSFHRMVSNSYDESTIDIARH